ncbi:MAG: 50S ribosomal protein L17 [Chryseotalea sp.]
MRHGKKINHLGRKHSHRAALLSNLASSLILNKRITTTVAKAKALRKYVEPLLTKAKNDTTHSRRTVFSYLGNKESVKELFGEVASKIANRPGGYTRIIKMSDSRLGDNAEVCLMELVDFNTLYNGSAEAATEKKAKNTRGRAKAKKEDETATEVTAEEKPKKASKKADKKEDQQ